MVHGAAHRRPARSGRPRRPDRPHRRSIAAGRHIGIVTRNYDAETVRLARRVVGTGQDVAPGSRREVRWAPVPGRPGVLAGIPVGHEGIVATSGVGSRVRWNNATRGGPMPYFDEDATGVNVLLGIGDEETQRGFWADPR